MVPSDLDVVELSHTDRQTDRQNVLFAIKITKMIINKETVKRQEISIKIETIACIVHIIVT